MRTLRRVGPLQSSRSPTAQTQGWDSSPFAYPNDVESLAVTSVTHIERYRRTTNERISTNDIEHIERYRRMNTSGSKCLTGSMCLKNRRLLRRGSMVLSRAFPAFSRPKYYFLDLLRTSTNTFWVFVLCDTKTRTYDTLDDIDLTTKGLCNRFWGFWVRTDLRHFPEKERLFMQRSLSLFTQNFIFVVYATGPSTSNRLVIINKKEGYCYVRKAIYIDGKLI